MTYLREFVPIQMSGLICRLERVHCIRLLSFRWWVISCTWTCLCSVAIGRRIQRWVCVLNLLVRPSSLVQRRKHSLMLCCTAPHLSRQGLSQSLQQTLLYPCRILRRPSIAIQTPYLHSSAVRVSRTQCIADHPRLVCYRISVHQG